MKVNSDIDRRERVERYLNSTHSTTWGRGFDIVRDDTREQAVQFILELIRRIEDDVR